MGLLHPIYKSIFSHEKIEKSDVIDDKYIYEWLRSDSIIYKKFDGTMTKTIVYSEDTVLDSIALQHKIKIKM